MKWILIAVIGLAASASTQPATAPSTQIFASKLENLSRQEKKAIEDAIARSHERDDYKKARGIADAKLKILENARRSGTPEQRLEASHAFVIEDQRAKAIEKSSISQDSVYLSAKTSIERAKNEIADQERKEESARLAEAERIANSPENRAIRDGKIILGMTESQAEDAFKKRKEHNVQAPNSGGGAISVSGAEAAGMFSVPPHEVIKKTRDDSQAESAVNFTKYLEYMNGSQYRIDEITVVFRNDRAVRVIGQ